MKRTLLILLMGVSAIGTAQITTDSYTIEQLVNDVILANTGITATNITSSSAINFIDHHSIGYFDKNGSTFNFESGVVLTSGSINDLPGPYPSEIAQITGWPGDTDIDTPGGWPTHDASSISFDFVAPTNFFSFNYLYAAGEFGGTEQLCQPIDPFAFILTDSDGNKINLAVLPGTNTPICNTIVNNGVDGSTICSGNIMISYGSYSPNPAPALPINIPGLTIPLTAHAQVVAGETYNLKIVMGDIYDTVINSALFIEQGSFQTTALTTDTHALFNEIRIYPNPADNILNIVSNFVIEEILMYNMLGQNVLKASPNTMDTTLNISTLIPGPYMLVFNSMDKVQTAKIVKQ